MDFEEFKATVNKLVAEICVICGLETYHYEKQAEIFQSQMRSIAKFIYEGYPYLTEKEIINAFYLNLQGKYETIVKVYGADKKINIEFIGQVLTGYAKYKQGYVNLNPEVINVINPPAAIQQSTRIEMTDDEEREMVEMEYQKFRRHADWNYQLVMPFIYYRLEKDGAIPLDVWKKKQDQAELILKRQKQKEKLIPTSTQTVKEYAEDGTTIYSIIKNHDTVKQIENELYQLRNGVNTIPELLAKQLCVKNYFSWMQRTGFEKIYSKEENNGN